MAILKLDPGTDHSGDLSMWPVTSTVTGTIATDTVQQHTGLRSIKSNVTGAGGEAYVRNASGDGLAAAAGRRQTAWLRFSTVSPSQASTFYQIYGSSAMINVNLNTNGKLQLVANAVTKNGSITLSADTWYRIAFSYITTSVSNWSAKVWINGVLDLSASNADGNLAVADADLCTIGLKNAAIMTAWVDDIYIDGGAGVDDPGAILLTAKRPAANNTNGFDTAVGANPANRWTNVNEVPISVTNGWRHAASTDVQENYTLEAAAVGDVDITGATIVGRMAWIWAKAASVAGTPKIMDNGTETAITLTTSAARYTVFTTSASYPSNAAGIGMRSTFNAADTFLYECGTVIAYTAAVAGDILRPFPVARAHYTPSWVIG